MNLDELAHQIHRLLSPLTSSCCPEVKVAVEKLLSLKNIEDPAILVQQLAQLIKLVDEWTIEEQPLIHLSKDDVKHLKDIQESIQTDLKTLVDSKELSTIDQLKAQLKKLFEAFGNILNVYLTTIQALNRRLTELEQDKTKVDQQLIQVEKEKIQIDRRLIELEEGKKRTELYKIIGDLLVPLTKEIHNYLRMLPGQPHKYDDYSIFKAYQYKVIGHPLREIDYKNSFEKSIDEQTYDEFYSWILHKAAILNVLPKQLLNFLCMKKQRNFACHRDIQDHFNDARISFRYELYHLLEAHALETLVEPSDYHALNQIYVTYFQKTIDELKTLEAQANAAV